MSWRSYPCHGECDLPSCPGSHGYKYIETPTELEEEFAELLSVYKVDDLVTEFANGSRYISSQRLVGADRMLFEEIFSNQNRWSRDVQEYFVKKFRLGATPPVQAAGPQQAANAELGGS